MLQKVRDVLASIKAKKANEEQAEKLNMEFDEYVDLKKKVLLVRQLVGDDENLIVDAIKAIENIDTIVEGSHEVNYNLEKGEAKVSALVSEEPHSPEDIIRLLKIDTDQWKLSQYWNKQRSDGWVVSALITKKKHEATDYLEYLLANWSPKSQKITTVRSTNTEALEKTAAVISLQDIHFGKEGNDTIAEDFKYAVEDLITRASKVAELDKVFYVVGGDLLNMDTFNGTTTSGTFVDNAKTAMDTYVEAFDALYWSVQYLHANCNELHVVYIPGNHDRLSSFHLAHALSKACKEDGIVWHTDYTERRVLKYEDNFLAFEHGDSNLKNSLLVYATENPMEWGQTRYRTLYTGHLHTKRKIEYITEDEKTGFAIKILPSLSKTDYWHYHNKFVGNRRAGVIDLHHPTKGLLCELVSVLDQ